MATDAEDREVEMHHAQKTEHQDICDKTKWEAHYFDDLKLLLELAGFRGENTKSTYHIHELALPLLRTKSLYSSMPALSHGFPSEEERSEESHRHGHKSSGKEQIQQSTTTHPITDEAFCTKKDDSSHQGTSNDTTKQKRPSRRVTRKARSTGTDTPTYDMKRQATTFKLIRYLQPSNDNLQRMSSEIDFTQLTFIALKPKQSIKSSPDFKKIFVGNQHREYGERTQPAQTPSTRADPRTEHVPRHFNNKKKSHSRIKNVFKTKRNP